MIHPIKITSTLADETRFQIYDYMLKTHKAYNVQEIADEFSIHPNVARLHLTKLAEIELITAEFMKTGKGGRPGRMYRVNEEGVQLSFPRRDYELLLRWLIETLAELGEEALLAGQKTAYKYGQQSISENYPNISTMSLTDKIDLLQEQAALIGYVADTDINGNKFNIKFHVYSCPFHSLLKQYSEIVCLLHENFLRGQVYALFGTLNFEQKTSMIHNCSDCKYSIFNGNESK